MRFLIFLNYLLCIPLLSFSQSPGELHLNGGNLKGSCENRFYTGFEIELDSTYSSLDHASLFAQFPRVGKINFKNRIDIPTEFTLTERAGYPQIMFRFRSDYLTFDNLFIQDQSISFTVNHDPDVPVTEKDLKIVQTAQRLLSKKKHWNKADDRNCTDDLANKSFSLYCALRIASLEVEEVYNHRNATLQKLRHLIRDKYPNRKWNHRLMDFNNMKETKYRNIVEMINEIEKHFLLELKDNGQ